MLHAKIARQTNGLNNLRSSVGIGRRGIQQVGVGTDRSEGQAVSVCHFAHTRRMAIQTRRRSETEIVAQQRTVVTVRKIRIFKAHLTNRLKLSLKWAKGVNEGKASNFDHLIILT